MRQTWHDLLFAHWPLPAAEVRARVPSAFTLDLWDGAAWLGVVPFSMTGVTLRGVPPLPWLSAFAELNVRTYVTVDGKPGVYFFSLDAERMLAVAAARVLNLPYYVATMRVGHERAEEIRYASRRFGAAAGQAEFEARYRPAGAPSHAVPGSLDYFLTERYCLYATHPVMGPYRLEINHPPWNLQPASAEIVHNSMAQAAGLRLPPLPPILHFAKRQDMVGWGPEFIRDS